MLDALRLGTHQLLSMRVPDHAAISTTVDLVRARVNTGAGNFANAVLRSVSEHDLDEWIETGRPGRAGVADPVRRDRLQPPGVGGRRAPRGGRRRRAARPARRRQRESPGHPGRAARPLDPRGAAGGADAVLAVRRGVGAAATRASVPAVAEGRAGVQDEGSQLVALALAEAPLEGRDELWLDLCAGPGGKAGLLAALAAERGATAGRQRAAAACAPGWSAARSPTTRASSRAWSAWSPPTAPLAPYRAGIFDRVLVDAPCTGLGALRRRPEARWRRKPDDLLALVMLQRQLVRAALDLVRPGGVVLYATCSPVISETSSVVTSVHGARIDAELEDLGPQFAGVPRLGGPGPRHRPALAAPARHRRDVHGAVPPAPRPQ